jgi:hypothetical protein
MYSAKLAVQRTFASAATTAASYGTRFGMRNSRQDKPRAPVGNLAGMVKRKTSGPYRCEATMRGANRQLLDACRGPLYGLPNVARPRR